MTPPSLAAYLAEKENNCAHVGAPRLEFFSIHLLTSQVEGKVSGDTKGAGDKKRGRILIEEVDTLEVTLRPFYALSST